MSRPAPSPPVSPKAAAQAVDLIKRAIGHHQSGAMPKALALYSQALRLHPGHFDALQLSGLAHLHGRDYSAAAQAFAQAIDVRPTDGYTQFNYGLALAGLGRREDALAAYDKAISLGEATAQIHHNRGFLLRELGQSAAALPAYEKCLAVDPSFSEAYNNYGIALRDVGRLEDALAAYNKVVALKPGFAEAHNNRGVVLADLRQFPAAIAAYDQAVALQPGYAEAHNNRGTALAALKQFDAAIASFKTALTLEPNAAPAHANLGDTLAAAKRYAEAVASYSRALTLDPGHPFIRGARLHLKMWLCDWQDLETEITDLAARVAHGEQATPTFPFFSMSDAPALQRLAAETWTRHHHPRSVPPVPPAPRHPGKIRIGYFSADFRQHPVSSLTVGMFEAHNREAFEITAFSFGPDTQDDMRLRLEAAFDRFIDVRTKSDSEIIAMAREAGLDVAVDLAGYTEGSRPGIFAGRAAPVQIAYLGYPGTMGADFIDYIVADDTIIPPEARKHFAEKVISLPCFQVNDAGRPMVGRALPRADLGLPESAFVFCCFNNSYKFTPATFSSWMRILAATQNSVLFLSADHPTVGEHLKAEAARRGIDGGRLIFTKRVAHADYYARFRSADLFLDTLPFTAHTMASDALWSGLPVLTLTGETLAARVATSLLKNLDLPELITTRCEDFEEAAMSFAADPARLANIRQKLARTRQGAALFDTKAFTRNIERAYITAHERYRIGIAPGDFSVL